MRKCLQFEEMKERSGIMSLSVLLSIRPQISGGLSLTTGQSVRAYLLYFDIWSWTESVTFYYDFIKNVSTVNTIQIGCPSRIFFLEIRGEKYILIIVFSIHVFLTLNKYLNLNEQDRNINLPASSILIRSQIIQFMQFLQRIIR